MIKENIFPLYLSVAETRVDVRSTEREILQIVGDFVRHFEEIEPRLTNISHFYVKLNAALIYLA